MGVHGLWKLIEPSGKPVPLETLENKVLAVDVSIWLHQAIKGFQDSKGAPLPNAHLLGIYHRVCKLLYFKIKPVFVFDGGVPALKKETIAKRNQLKAKHSNDANKIQKQILNTLLKHTAVNKVLSEQTKSILPVKYKPGQEPQSDDLFKLPPSQLDSTFSSSEDEEMTTTSTDSSPTKHWDIHTIDEKSSQFRALPADVRHEILTDLKETRKQSSWGRIHELPTESNEFSGYQMKRLLKRWSIQSSLEETEKEMGGHSLSLGELESLLNDHGVITEEAVGNRIASDENTRFLYIKDVKKAMEKARLENLKADAIPEIEDDGLQEDLEYQQDLNLAIQMSLQDGASTSKEIEKSRVIKQTVSNLQIFSAAKGYMMEYSGLTPAGINEIIMGNKSQEEVSDSEQDQSIVSKIFNLDSPVQSESSKSDFKDISQLSPVIEEKELGFKKTTDLIENEPIEVPEDVDLDILAVSKPEIKSQAEVELSEQVKTINVLEISNSESRNAGGDGLNLTANEPESDSADNLLEVSLPGLQENNAAVTSEANDLIESNNEKDSDSGDDFLEVPVGESMANAANDRIDNKAESDSGDDFLEVPIGESTENAANDKMDDAAESDSGDDFLEVPESTTVEAKNVLEVVIDVKGKMEDDDDLFSDIFTTLDENKVEVQNKKQVVNLSKLLVQKDDEKAVDLTKEEEMGPADAEVVSNKEQNEASVKADEGRIIPSLTTGELRQMERNLEVEKQSLIVERSNKERLANNITDQMYQEAQELLQLFGVPYIVAPMEAEAQCAFLNEANLTDGTITDDSDIWLFGGKIVYKNFFNQSKHVMQFCAEDIEHHFNLSRLKLIQLSLLVGSDYTVGLQGIGPVTALEILAAFPSYNENAALSYQQVISGLIRFRTWFNKGRIAGPGKTALRTKLRNLEVTENFPSANVARAYLEPKVEDSREQFSWGKPDIIALTDYAKQKFGWTQKKSEEILKPVLKRLQETKAQTTIKDYFKTKHKIDVVDLSEKMSKRVKTAVSRMGQDPTADGPEKEKKTRARKTKPRKSKKIEVDEDLVELQRVEMASTSKVKEIEEDVKKQLERNLKRTLNAKAVIHQKERDRSELAKNKMKAIESFRKSKHGPGFVKKRAKVVRRPKDDAELSENTSDDD